MRIKIKGMADHKEFLKRINKTLYYGQLPALPCLSLPVTEVTCEAWSAAARGRSLRRLRVEQASQLTRGSCVSPCTLVLALLYLERLRAYNPDYLALSDPNHLFLVSLMVGSKYLEDSGEDDEVLFSEWAEGSGLEIDELKRLEIEFLKAIDWKVYVSQKSFDEQLLWLEKQVALKQGQQRGFFTYTDLRVVCEETGLREMVSYLATTWIAITFSYLSSVLTLLTSTLLISQAWTPAVQNMTATQTTAPSTVILNTNIITSNNVQLTDQLVNTTMEEILQTDEVVEEPYVPSQMKCCLKWSKYEDKVTPKVNWLDSLISIDWVSYETWWSETSVLNWLYQSSLISPMQRWLEKFTEINEFVKSKVVNIGENSRSKKCNHVSNGGFSGELCTRQWLNLSKLGALVVSVSDR